MFDKFFSIGSWWLVALSRNRATFRLCIFTLPSSLFNTSDTTSLFIQALLFARTAKGLLRSRPFLFLKQRGFLLFQIITGSSTFCPSAFAKKANLRRTLAFFATFSRFYLFCQALIRKKLKK